MSACYFWKDGKVIQIDHEVYAAEASSRKLNDCPSVDTFSNNPDMRYGRFLKHSGWVTYPLKTFPKEFRAWLLINL